MVAITTVLMTMNTAVITILVITIIVLIVFVSVVTGSARCVKEQNMRTWPVSSDVALVARTRLSYSLIDRSTAYTTYRVFDAVKLSNEGGERHPCPNHNTVHVRRHLNTRESMPSHRSYSSEYHCINGYRTLTLLWDVCIIQGWFPLVQRSFPLVQRSLPLVQGSPH